MYENDAAAVAQALAGDQEAFRFLVERHSRSIFRLAFRMTRNQEDADEVVQESFLRAYKRLDRYQSRASFATWLYRIAVNCSLDLLEKRRQHEQGRVAHDPESDLPELQIAATDPTPDRLVLGGELKARIEEVLESLTPAERTAFLMRHVEGRSVEEIAAALRIRAGAAKNSIFRAVQKMRRALEPALRPVR